jgi:hypothetical protein
MNRRKILISLDFQKPKTTGRWDFLWRHGNREKNRRKKEIGGTGET